MFLEGFPCSMCFGSNDGYMGKRGTPCRPTQDARLHAYSLLPECRCTACARAKRARMSEQQGGIRLRFFGRRFHGKRLPISVLPDIEAFRELLAAFARAECGTPMRGVSMFRMGFFNRRPRAHKPDHADPGRL